MKKDVLLLADAFEKLFDMCLKFCNLDHCHYFSSPGLNWDAMLKMTGVKLEKKWAIDMYWFIEKPTNENTNKRTKDNKGNSFSCIKTSKREKIGSFALWYFLHAQNIFVKIINWLKIVLIASFTILLETSYNCTIWCSARKYQEINSCIVSKGAMNKFREMFPPARMFPPAVMHAAFLILSPPSWDASLSVKHVSHLLGKLQAAVITSFLNKILAIFLQIYLFYRIPPDDCFYILRSAILQCLCDLVILQIWAKIHLPNDL